MLMLRGMLAFVAALALGAPLAAQAGTLRIFDASVGAGNTVVLSGPVSGAVLDLDYDGSTAEGGGVFGLAASLVATGDLVIDAFTCELAGCLGFGQAPGTSISGNGGDDLNGDFGVLGLGQLTFSGTQGTIEVAAGGNYLGADFSEYTFDNQILARVSITPEPASLVLLGMGIAGLAFIRRPRRV